MRYNPRVSIAVAMGLFASAFLAPSKAGTITNTASFTLPGFSTGSLSASLPVSPNNDNTSVASSNSITSSIFFNSGGLGPAYLEFLVANSGGITEYRFSPSGFGFVNNTGTPFTGFRAELGFGTGMDFVPSTVADGLDFDTPDRDPVPTLPAFATLTHDSDRLLWSGGTIPSVGGFSLGFALDVPDGLQAFHPDGLNTFTIRLTPVSVAPVPEPATGFLLLLGLSSAALALRGGR